MKKLLIIYLLLVSCSHFPSQNLTRTELYFGLSKPDGSVIEGKDFQAFADTVLTPTFGNGSTLIDGRGQWLGANGRLVTEPSKVLVVVSKMTTLQSAQIEAVRYKYRKYFQQESVMRVDTKANVGF